MRLPILTWALPLVCLQSVNALDLVRGRGHFQRMADRALSSDGTSVRLGNGLRTSIQRLGPPRQLNDNETVEAEFIELPLDHFESEEGESGTFLNQFWVRDAGYTPGAPVFLYDAGEGAVGDGWRNILLEEDGFFRQIVDKYNGIGIVWEHRYYGNSTPVEISVDTPAEDLKYLTAEQALADVNAFAWTFSRDNINSTLTPDSTPWVFIGGSYPGMRAAFMRELYPQTIWASFASSAPVEAQVDMSEYWEPVVRGLTKYGYGNATRDIHAAIEYIDDILDNDEDAAAELKDQFLGLGGANNSHETFAETLSTVFYSWQSYGVDFGLSDFCDWISTDPETNATAPAEGFAATKGAKWVVDRWASYPDYAQSVGDSFATECTGSTTRAGECDLDQRYTDADTISWTWQHCTQWGFFQSANLGPNQIISKYNSLEHAQHVCHRQFPDADSSLLPEWPDVEKTNQILGGWKIRPSQVYWSGGEFDPWRTLSPLSAEPGAPHPMTFTDAPECGMGQDEGSIFGYVMEDAQHCYDFDTIFPAGEVSRGYFTSALDKWLPCFEKPGPEEPEEPEYGTGKMHKRVIRHARDVRKW